MEPSTQPAGRRPRRRALRLRLQHVSWRDLALVAALVVLVVGGAIWAAIVLVRPAPPNTIRLLGGPPGSSYLTTAERYQKIIEKYGVKVQILPSKGALDNLRLLARKGEGGAADVGLVQGGLTDGLDITGLVSLGSVFAQPIMLYHRLSEPIDRLGPLKGKRLAVGPEGSGTRALALKLLAANEVDAASTTLLPLGGEEAAQALISGAVDAAFLMGDSATPKVMRSLRETPDVQMMSWRQAAGYTRRFRFLTRMVLPEGAMDLARNIPPTTVELVGPTVELVARGDLHPALSDLLIGAAREVHGAPGMFRDAGQFPAAQEHEFPISEDAQRFYKSGGQFLYKNLPFWLASLIDRTIVVIVPLLVIIVPATRVAPTLYRWRVRSRIYRWYGALMSIERDLSREISPEQRAALIGRLDQIEDAVNGMRLPVSFADQLYVLREHVSLVRHRLEAGGPPQSLAPASAVAPPV